MSTNIIHENNLSFKRFNLNLQAKQIQFLKLLRGDEKKRSPWS